MQGFAFQTTRITFFLLSMSFITHLTYAASVNMSSPEINNAVGCMSCHQGETVTLADKAFAENNLKKTHSKDQKKKAVLSE